MTREIRSEVLKIDDEIRRHEWFDFHVISFDGERLTVAGGTDLTYYHKLEIIFLDVFFVSGYFNGWHSDTKRTTFVMTDEFTDMYAKYKIEQGYHLFLFKTEDYENDMVIAAKNISYNTDIVYYYNRPDLKENERLAHFVKTNNAL